MSPSFAISAISSGPSGGRRPQRHQTSSAPRVFIAEESDQIPYATNPLPFQRDMPLPAPSFPSGHHIVIRRCGKDAAWTIHRSLVPYETFISSPLSWNGFPMRQALVFRHPKQVAATMLMPNLHSTHLSALKIGRSSRSRPDASIPSRRQRRARLTAVLNAAAIFLSLAGIVVLLVTG